MGDVIRASVTSELIDVADCEAAVVTPEFGAVVSFAGLVRDHDHGRTVTGLEYSAHPSANEVLTEVAESAAGGEGVGRIAIAHRIGPLAVGDAAFVVVVSAAHRGPAFDACRALVDEAKAQLPIWKHQLFGDGTSEWVNCP